MTDAQTRFAAALTAAEPAAAHPKRIARFGRLVGSWRVSASRLDEASGAWVPSAFTWHVAYILDGRAVQDVSVRETADGA